MAIVLISEALLARSALRAGQLLRDRVLSGFCVRMNARKKTFGTASNVGANSSA